jgi:hypothetical protein
VPVIAIAQLTFGAYMAARAVYRAWWGALSVPYMVAAWAFWFEAFLKVMA